METLLLSFTTFFATIDPVGASVIFAAMTVSNTRAERKSFAIRGTLIATLVMVLFAFLGDAILTYMGITLPALRMAGGVLLLLIAMDMVFAQNSGANSATEDERQEAVSKQDISVCPLAMPLIAGPGSIGAAILLVAQSDGDHFKFAMVMLGLLLNLVLVLVLLLLSSQVQKLFGLTAINVLSRVIGVLLAALSMQFLIDGVKSSGMFG